MVSFNTDDITRDLLPTNSANRSNEKFGEYIYSDESMIEIILAFVSSFITLPSTR